MKFSVCFRLQCLAGRTSSIRRIAVSRDWRILASWGPFQGSLKPLEHHSIIVLRGSRRILNFFPYYAERRQCLGQAM